MIRQIGLGLMLGVFVILVGCSDDRPASTQPVKSDPAGQKFMLSDEPPAVQGVMELRKNAKNGDEVAVVGRIGGSTEPFLDGRAGFTIVDVSFKPCNERDGDECPTPWDYCCDPKELLTTGTISVKFTDEQGKTLATDARKLLGLKELNTVVVKGKAQRDSDGNLVVLATGLYRRADVKK